MIVNNCIAIISMLYPVLALFGHHRHLVESFKSCARKIANGKNTKVSYLSDATGNKDTILMMKRHPRSCSYLCTIIDDQKSVQRIKTTNYIGISVFRNKVCFVRDAGEESVVSCCNSLGTRR